MAQVKQLEQIKQVDHQRHHIYIPKTLGARAADVITNFVGSWLFVGIHAAWFIVWIVFHVEPFPFGLLTLLVSLEAIFLSTFVMMSQNRAAQRDHARDDHEAQEVDMLFNINQTQLQILQLLQKDLCAPDAAARVALPKPSQPAAAPPVRAPSHPQRRRRR